MAMDTADTILYMVVEFQRTNGCSELEVIPSNWGDKEGNQCILYPSHYTDERLLRAAKRAEAPTDKWEAFPVKQIRFKSESWNKANERCNRLLDTSHVETSSESEDDLPRLSRKRKTRQPIRIIAQSPAAGRKTKKLDSLSLLAEELYDDEEETIIQTTLPFPPSAPTMLRTLSHNEIVEHETPKRPSSAGAGPSSLTKSSNVTSGRHRSLFTSRVPVNSSAQDRQMPMPSDSVARQPRTATEINSFETRVFTILEKILEKQRAHEAILKSIAERQKVAADDPTDNDDDLPHLPCASHEHLQKLELVLSQSDSTQKKLSRRLSLVGGGVLRSVVGNVMPEILAHDISKTYNLTGAKGRKSFGQYTTLLRTIIRSIRRNNNHKNETEDNIKDQIRKWFTNSRDRMGDRKIRMQEAAARASNVVSANDTIDVDNEN